jgi:hypothetical protein
MKKELKEIFDKVLLEASIIDFKSSGQAQIEFNEIDSIERMKNSLSEAINYLELYSDLNGDIVFLPAEGYQSKNNSKKQEKKNLKRLNKLNSGKKLSYLKKRKLINKILKSGQDICFDYEKVDGTIRNVNVSWDDNFTYDSVAVNSDFTYLYDSDSGIFKHFKLDKIMDIKFCQSIPF